MRNWEIPHLFPLLSQVVQLHRLDRPMPTLRTVQTCHRQTAAPLRILLVHDASAPRRLYELRVLFFQNREIPLGFPVPDGVGGEDEVHFFKGPLVCLWVEGPDHGDGDGVTDAEDVKRFLVDGTKHDWTKESL